tara:strand:- start:19950 stop:20849 length:900 start_codon:yes stop_codon:yes gene_type:complete
MKTNKNLIFIAGPTGIGKTDFSIEVAKKLNTEIISCDSRQFYKELLIGTSPPNESQLKEVKHHFIHNKSIHDQYNVGLYEKDALKIIYSLFKRKDHIVFVGGSGLYADSVIYGFDKFPIIPKKIRDNVRNLFNEKGIEYLQKKIQKLDPKYFNEVDINNSMRLMRALELIEYTGKSFSSMRSGKNKKRNFNTSIISLECPRELLYQKINERVEKMLDNGLEKEVFKLRKFKNLNTLNTVGYKEFINYFEGKMTYEETINKIKQNTRNYAKRQITWFKKYTDAKKINISKNLKIDFNKII